jgi:iron(III) transport system substrate-binding protein
MPSVDSVKDFGMQRITSRGLESRNAKAWLAGLVSALSLLSASNVSAQQLNIVCSMNPEWCRNAALIYERTANVKVSVINKPTGESFAQIVAEKERPKVDVWFGGTSDPHFQAAEQGLTVEYRSPLLAQLHPWAQDAAKAAGYKTVGLYSEVLGIAFNTELLAKKKLAAPKCWKDLANPIYKGEVQMANAQSSGTSYVAIATFVQIMGEENAFAFMKAMHKNINTYSRQGLGPIKAVAKGESAVSVSFLHNAAQEAEQKFPVTYAAPCEGTGYSVGAMSIVKGAPHLEEAKKFYDWALSPAGQRVAATSRSYPFPSNKATPIPEGAPSLKGAKFINYDLAKFGASAERRRLIERWEKELSSQAR